MHLLIVILKLLPTEGYLLPLLDLQPHLQPATLLLTHQNFRVRPPHQLIPTLIPHSKVHTTITIATVEAAAAAVVATAATVAAVAVIAGTVSFPTPIPPMT